MDEPNQQSFLSLTAEDLLNSEVIKRKVYQPLHSLLQDYKILDINSLNKDRAEFYTSRKPLTEKYAIFDRKNVTSFENIKWALELK